MALSISILNRQINSEDLYFTPTTSRVLEKIFEKYNAELQDNPGLSNYGIQPLKNHPSLLDNEVQPLVDKYIELEEHEFKEKAVAFIKSALYVAIIAGFALSTFVGTSGLLPLGLVVAWFALQIWIAHDVVQKVEEIAKFNPEQKEYPFPFTGLMFLGFLSMAPLWEVYTRKERIEEALSTGLPIKLQEAIQFFDKQEHTKYIGPTCEKNGENPVYRAAVNDIYKLQLLCTLYKKLTKNL